MTARPTPPRLPLALIRALLPYAERGEVLADLAEEHAERAADRGPMAADLWLWRQVLRSAPALLRRSWWRGWSGFEPRANSMRPGGLPMESWIMDMRYAVRRLRSRPTYALLAVLTLALGVGGTASIFGIVRGLLIDPLPYAREEQVSVFWNPFDWSETEFLHLQPDFPGFQKVAAYRTGDVTLRLGDAPPRLVPGVLSSAELFDVLGARPAAGRGFQAGDDRPGAEPIAILSHGLWQELGGDPSIVGRRVRLDGAERTVVGIMPRGFWFPDPAVRVWLPTPLSPERGSGNYALVGRRAPGVSEAATTAGLKQITDALAARFQYPEQWDKTKNAALTPVREFLLGRVRLPLLATLAAMAVILLIACANVAALMLGQVEGRTTELAVRSALGAGRRRLTQQLLGEALVVGLLAGVVGALLAWRGFGLLVGALPLGALAEGTSPDWTLFWAAIALAVLASLAIALAPVAFLRRGDLQSAISRTRTAGVGGRGRVESGLVVAEVALAVLLAAGAGLLIRSVAKLRGIDPGVSTRGVAVLDIAASSDVSHADR
ncbi:MAG TPA: ABC transporter permease, partial [Gemmatimonadaceae bacterium]|nr:ABC transporter permease [Gemmatimonadaceae bacterium]